MYVDIMVLGVAKLHTAYCILHVLSQNSSGKHCFDFEENILKILILRTFPEKCHIRDIVIIPGKFEKFMNLNMLYV